MIGAWWVDAEKDRLAYTNDYWIADRMPAVWDVLVYAAKNPGCQPASTITTAAHRYTLMAMQLKPHGIAPPHLHPDCPHDEAAALVILRLQGAISDDPIRAGR